MKGIKKHFQPSQRPPLCWCQRPRETKSPMLPVGWLHTFGGHCGSCSEIGQKVHHLVSKTLLSKAPQTQRCIITSISFSLSRLQIGCRSAGLGSKSWVGSGLLPVSLSVPSSLGCVFLMVMAEAAEHKPNGESTFTGIYSVQPSPTSVFVSVEGNYKFMWQEYG